MCVMAILILTEGGNTRRFNLRAGKLSFGSGADVTLRLASEDVAERHGEIEMGEGGAVLRCGKGVLPAMVAGKAASGDLILRDGQQVKVGSATLSVEYAEGEGPPAAAQPVARSRPSSGGGGRARGAARTRDRGDADEGERRPRRTVQRKSDPTGMIIGIGVAVVLIGIAYMFINKASSGLAGEEFVFETAYDRAERGMETDAVASRVAFRRLKANPALTANQRAQVDTRLAELDKRLDRVDESVRNDRGTKWFDVRLKDYAKRFDVTESRPHARLFVKRSKWFMGEFPTHPENAWIERMLARVNSVAELSSPATIEDLRVEVWGSVEKAPKDFIDAEQAIDRFVASGAEASAKGEAETLRAETRTKEREHYDKMIANAMASGDKQRFPTNYNAGLAMDDLIKIMVTCNDSGLRSDGARRVLMFEELTPKWIDRHYKQDRKFYWSRMIEVPAMRAWASDNGLL